MFSSCPPLHDQLVSTPLSLLSSVAYIQNVSCSVMSVPERSECQEYHINSEMYSDSCQDSNIDCNELSWCEGSVEDLICWFLLSLGDMVGRHENAKVYSLHF